MYETAAGGRGRSPRGCSSRPSAGRHLMVYLPDRHLLHDDRVGSCGMVRSPPPPLTRFRKFAILPIARRKQAGPERRCFERSALTGVRGCRVDATLCHATLYRATLCQRCRGCQFNHGVYA